MTKYGRRTFLGGVSASALLIAAAVTSRPLRAQQDGAISEPFSFDFLTEAARLRAAEADKPGPALEGIFADFNYDDYNLIAYRHDHAVWNTPGSSWRLMPFHVGWLFKEPVRLYEVVDGRAVEMSFTTTDFEYRHRLKDRVPADIALPGVAGFKLSYPLNRPDIMDELIAFLGASYFRALGRSNAYGLSARGLAINSGLARAEEFPRFSAFWVERPLPGDTRVTVYASLDSESATGAYRFVVIPGAETVVEVTARLFFRTEIEQLGIAPLTSMFLFDGVNRLGFDDYRPQVHDSNGLRIERADGDVIWRALNNPARLSGSYFTETSPRRFGLHQRGREFEFYQDAQAHYERRPSVDVEPIGDWGTGTVRLVEIPSDLEVHDNIGAFWIPETPVQPGEMREFAYRLHWGRLDPALDGTLAVVLGTRSGVGGAAGVAEAPDTRKFVVDFGGGLLGQLAPDDDKVQPVITVSGGAVEVAALSKIDGENAWRLAMDIKADGADVLEMSAHIAGYDRKLSEIWSFQWVKP